MTKFKRVLKKTAAVLAAAVLTISGLAGTGSFGDVLRNGTEVVNAFHDESAGIVVTENGLYKSYDGSEDEPFVSSDIMWEPEKKLLTLMNFGYKRSTLGVTLDIQCDDVTIKLYGVNEIKSVDTGIAIKSKGKLTIEGPGLLGTGNANPADVNTFTYIETGADLEINDCHMNIKGFSNCDNYVKVANSNVKINNSYVGFLGKFIGSDDEQINPVVNGTAIEYDGSDVINGQFLDFCNAKLDANSAKIYDVNYSGVRLIVEPKIPMKNISGVAVAAINSDTASAFNPAFANVGDSSEKVVLTAPAKNLSESMVFSIINLCDINDKTKVEFSIANYKSSVSIADILRHIYWLSSTSTQHKNLAEAWLTYGAYAQQYFNYNTNNLATSYIDANTWSNEDKKVYKNLDEEGVKGVASSPADKDFSYVGSSLILGNTNGGFYCGEIMLKNYYMTDLTDEEVKERLSDKECINLKKENATDYSDCITVNLTTLDKKLTDDIGSTCSVYDYIYSIIENSKDPNTDKLVWLCCALYEFGEAAKAAAN